MGSVLNVWDSWYVGDIPTGMASDSFYIELEPSQGSELQKQVEKTWSTGVTAGVAIGGNADEREQRS